MTDGPTHALVRKVARSYAAYYARRGRNVSAQLAGEQLHNYVRALETSGLAVSLVEADDALPDCVFIEDTAVVWKEHALITCMHPDRQGEQAAVEGTLQYSHSLTRVPPGAALEGGDVLHTSDTTYVGTSARTNQIGAESLRSFLTQFGRRVVTLPVRNCLHLKTGVSYLGNGMLLAVPGWFDMNRFDVEDVIYTADNEVGSANCLRLYDRLLIPDGYPNTTQRLQQFASKYKICMRPLNISEFEKGDGSLTCLSLIW